MHVLVYIFHIFGLNYTYFKSCRKRYSSRVLFRSVDGLRNANIRNTHVPLWNYALFRFQVIRR